MPDLICPNKKGNGWGMTILMNIQKIQKWGTHQNQIKKLNKCKNKSIK